MQIPKNILRSFGLAIISLGSIGTGSFLAAQAQTIQTNIAVVVRHAPSLNHATIQGSLQQLAGENVTINGGFVMSGDLLVPGTPSVVLNGKPAYAGTIAGSGSALPSGYQVTLNGNCKLNYLRTRTTPVAIPAVVAPPAPSGTRSVAINAAGQSYGDATTLLDLTLNGNVGAVPLPPGTYGTMTVNGKSSLVIGVAGGTEPAVYNFQNLNLNSGSIAVAGPVIVTVANGFSANGTLGSPNNPAWLQLQIASGGLTLNGGSAVYGLVTAPTGTVIVNGNSTLVGASVSDQLTLNGGLIQWAFVYRPPMATNQTITLAENSSTNIVLTGSDPQRLPLTYTVLTQPAHGTLSGTPPVLTYRPATNYYGNDVFTFGVNDGVTSSVPATISLVITQVFYPPVAFSQSLTNLENASLPITLSGSDPQGLHLTYTILTQPGHGILSGGAPNLIYLPSTNYYGTDAFTFQVNNGIYNSMVAIISITNRPVDYPPVVMAGPNQTIILPNHTVNLAGSVAYAPFPGTVDTVQWSKVNGPGSAVFSNPSSETTTVTFGASGVYQLRLTASDSFLSSSSDLYVIVDAPPVVGAGSNSINTFPGVIVLQGMATDDGLPSGSLTTLWSVVSGPGTVVFGNPSATNSSATFSTNGIYILRLTASDGIATSSSDVSVIENLPPVVNAGPAQKVNLGSPVTLAGTIADDGLPYNVLHSAWTEVSGPGTAIFADAAITNTTVTFDQPGLYTLRLTGDDGFATNSADLIIGVNAPPMVSAGADQVAVLGSPVTLAGSFTDDGISGLPVTVEWSQISGPSGVMIASSAITNTTVSFNQSGVYVFQLTANDGMANSSAQTTVLVDQAPTAAVDSPPLINWPINQVTLTGTVTDDGLPVGMTLSSAWGVVSGPGHVTFSPVAQTDTLSGDSVTNPIETTATFDKPGVYVLSLTMDDSVASNTVTVTVTLNQPPVVTVSPVVVNWPSNQVTLTGTVTDDGLPEGTIVTAWDMENGPGSATFSPLALQDTSPPTGGTNNVVTMLATFSQPGVYSVSLTADDMAAAATATTSVILNQVPVVNAGSIQTVTFGTPATLAGTITDDGLPYNILNSTWTQVGGPGNATFANATATNTTVTFDQPGVYTLRLTGSDGFATSSATSQVFAPAALQPYAVDSSTLMLFHFNEVGGSVTTNVGSLGGNAYCVSNSAGATLPPTVTNILGATAYAPGFGTAASFTTSKLIGYDYNKSGSFNGDVSSSSLSADAFPMSVLNMGNGGQTPWTLEAMICPTVTNANQEIITTDSSAGNRGFQFRLNTAGQLELNLIYLSTDITVPIPTLAKDPVNGYASNTWYHVAATYDGAKLVLYWTKMTTTTTAANPISTNVVAVGSSFGSVTGPLGIGNRTRGAASETFLGKIDEVRISNVARSAAQMFFTSYLPVVSPIVISPVNPIYAGTLVTLSATVSGPKPMAYNWQCDGGTGGAIWTNLSNSTTNSYTIDTTGMTAGNYQYRLVASNSNGAATNNPATLNLLAASGPVLIADASVAPAIVFAGGSATLSATFTGSQPLSYQWYYTNNGTITAVSGATSSTYTLTGLQTNNSGGYFLVASNNPPGLGAQMFSDPPAWLTVLPSSSSESGMYCELLEHPEQTYITASNPKFGWNYAPSFPNDMQSGYRIIVSSSLALANAGIGNMWDSGLVSSSNSINVAYAGSALQGSASYFWRVQTRNSANIVGTFSAVQQFNTASQLFNAVTQGGVVYQQPSAGSVNCYPLRYAPVAPVLITTNSLGHLFIDFGNDAFGYATVQINGNYGGTNVTFGLGELAAYNIVNTSPGATIRYWSGNFTMQNGNAVYTNRSTTAVGTISPPAAYGIVSPFRYLELSGLPAGVTLTTNNVTQWRLQTEFNDNAATFSSSSAALNSVWGLCQYSMKALTFDGIYVDGDRERTPYEADTYLHMLSSYGMNNDFTTARCTFEYMTNHMTWPTEWPAHLVFAAWADYQQTGDPYLMTKYYGFLTNKCMLLAGAGTNALVKSTPVTGNTASGDIIDWYRISGDGVGNVDGYVAGSTNAVINAFYYRCLTIMANVASLTGHATDAANFAARANLVYSNYNSIFWNSSSQSYNDCEGSTHSSADANFFPLAFGLVPASSQAAVINYLHSRIGAVGSMPAGVYGAQYMLEGMFLAGDSDTALGLMSTNNTRSWMNMINMGSTISCEAWSTADKNNEDLNHAWGAAPANLIPRYVLGVRPLSAGYGQILIQPQLGTTLTYARGTVPTIRGPVSVAVTNGPTYQLTVTIPGNVTATVELPTTNTVAYVDGTGVSGTVSGNWLVLNNIGSGQHVIGLSSTGSSGSTGNAPDAPTSLAATAGDGQVALTWDATANAAGYQVKSTPASGGTFTVVANVSSPTFTDTTVTNGTLYYYVVSAANAAGTGADSAPVSARPTAASAPQMSSTPGKQLQISWPSPNTGWLLQVQTNGLGTNWTTIESSDSTNQYFVEPDPQAQNVFFRLVHP